MAIGTEIESERIEYHSTTVLSVACCSEDNTVLSGMSITLRFSRSKGEIVPYIKSGTITVQLTGCAGLSQNFMALFPFAFRFFSGDILQVEK